jgi:vitamin B12 transporter
MKTIVCKRFVTLMMILALMCPAVRTAGAEEPKKKETLDDLVVTAIRTAERPIDVPVSTEVITREKIEMSGATHVGDLIGKYITGHYHKYNGLLSPVGLRGFRTEAHGDDVKGYVLILVDGHRIGTGNLDLHRGGDDLRLAAEGVPEQGRGCQKPDRFDRY